MRKRILITVAASFSLLAWLGCSGGASTDSSSGSTPTPVPTPTATATATPSPSATPTAPTVSDSAPLAIQLYTVYDTVQYVNQLTFVETGTSSCSATAANPVVTCTAIVPEGRLYFSALTFQYSWTTTKCKLMTFQPYYYRASISPTYTVPGATSSIDCSGTVAPPSASCWGGAAPKLAPNFPNKTGIIYEPDESVVAGPQTAGSTLPSANSGNVFSNRLTCNDLKAADYGNNYLAAALGGAGDGYVAGSFVNYTFSCRDDWFDPLGYIINLVITDQNTQGDAPGTGVNNFYSWDELP